MIISNATNINKTNNHISSYSLNTHTQKTTTYDVGNPGPDLLFMSDTFRNNQNPIYLPKQKVVEPIIFLLKKQKKSNTLEATAAQSLNILEHNMFLFCKHDGTSQIVRRIVNNFNCYLPLSQLYKGIIDKQHGTF